MACQSSILVFLFMACTHFVSTSSTPSLKKQASILISIKKDFEFGTEPSKNHSLHTWDLSNYNLLCSWTGVQCDHEKKSVISLDISNSNISGAVSDIHKLPDLKFLNISNNQFNGSLNWEFSQFKNLLVIDAYNNGFNGFLPLGVTEIPNLTHLDFGGNYFSGRIPSEYGTLSKLRYLSLAGNDLSGVIPAEIGNLTSLERLFLGYFNVFEGGIPPEMGNLVNLVHLDVSSCGMVGLIPSELGKLKKLDTLFLHINQLTGVIPPELGNLSSLKVFDLSNNGLTGEIPLELRGLRELTLMNLFINRFHGEIPDFIAELPKLESLKLWQNNFTGTIPVNLGMNGKLTELDLSSNKLTGVIPKLLCYGRRLKILILLNNFLFGALPDDIGQCVSLTRVRAHQNYLSGSIPSGFLYLPELSLVELQNNYLTGIISEDTRNNASPNLRQMNLSNNRLSGKIPDSIGNFSGLQILLLSNNHFTGVIPSEIGRLKNVLNLDMSRNNLTGIIPPEIGNCLLLTYLDLSQNQLSGAVPVQIAHIHILNYLNVSWNILNHSLPKEIGSIKSLTYADFSHNNFSGKIPEDGQYSFFNYTSFLGNPWLCSRSYTNSCNYSSVASSSESSHRQNNVPGKWKLIFALGLLVCSLIFAIFAIIKTRKVMKNSNSWNLTTFQKLDFASEDILECIKDNNIIGKGGAGIVYRGTMPNGEQVAVKKLLGISKGSSHDNGLSAEIQTLGKIRHRNIVRLIAFCSNKMTNLLVYEYMENGSLGEVLHGKNGAYLKWETRLKIAIEAAKGLCYLHHDCSPLIIHRDVKSNNILLNADFEAHVADFGLAKFFQDNGTSECMSAIAGSYGYIAPEYAYTLKVDEKSDVYSFGVVLLELITGRRPVGDFGEEGLDIVQWTKIQTDGIKENVAKVLDERLKNNVTVNESVQVFFVAILCVQEHSVERPTMREVVQMLAEAKQPNTFQL